MLIIFRPFKTGDFIEAAGTAGTVVEIQIFTTTLKTGDNRLIHIPNGSVIGSNITNPLVAIGGGAVLSTYWVPLPLIHWDLVMETATAAALLGYLIFTQGKLGRWGGLYLICLYIAYIVIRFTVFSVD